MNEMISCIYWSGGYGLLPQNWQGHNLVLTESVFYYIEKGSIVLQIDGQTITAVPGDLILIPAQTMYSCWLTEERYAEKSWCHFNVRSGAGEFFEKFSIPPVLHVKDRRTVSRLFRQLFSTHKTCSPHNNIVATTAICGLVQYYFEHSTITENEIAPDRIRRVIDHIDRHYAENISLEELAQLSNYSTTHLSKYFRDVTGYPPIRYLNNVRLLRARHFLQYTDEPISKVVELCGFSDAAYFSRSFKKKYGCSPQIFRDAYYASNKIKK